MYILDYKIMNTLLASISLKGNRQIELAHHHFAEWQATLANEQETRRALAQQHWQDRSGLMAQQANRYERSALILQQVDELRQLKNLNQRIRQQLMERQAQEKADLAGR
jgi:hypothetical protein